LGAHAVVRCSPGGEHKTQFAFDRHGGKVHPGSCRLARGDVLLGARCSLSKLRCISGNDHQPRWALGRFTSSSQCVEDRCGILSRIDVQCRWYRSARCKVVRCFGEKH
jgi:hypothetical protein